MEIARFRLQAASPMSQWLAGLLVSVRSLKIQRLPWNDSPQREIVGGDVLLAAYVNLEVPTIS